MIETPDTVSRLLGHFPPPVSSHVQDMHNHFTTDSLQYWTMFDYYVQMQESWSAPGAQDQN